MPSFKYKHFGLDITKPHRVIYQLRDLLKLDYDQFTDMKERFREITNRYLDVTKTATAQAEALDMAIDDLQTQLPALFMTGNIEQRIYFARRVFLLHHTNRRKMRSVTLSRLRKQRSTNSENHPTPSTPKPGPSLAERMAANLLSITNGTQAPKIFASPTPQKVNTQPYSSGSAFKSVAPQQRSLATPMPMPNPDANAKVLSSSTNTQVSFPRHGLSHTKRPNAIEVKNTSISTPATSSSNIIASSSNPRPTSPEDTQGRSGSSVAVPSLRGNQIHSVHKFLDAAIPSMAHLLHRFIEFGCLGEDFLFAVSTWPAERIRTFLKSLPLSPEGSGLTKMEVDILTYHFESYFVTGDSKTSGASR